MLTLKLKIIFFNKKQPIFFLHISVYQENRLESKGAAMGQIRFLFSFGQEFRSYAGR